MSAKNSTAATKAEAETEFPILPGSLKYETRSAPAFAVREELANRMSNSLKSLGYDRLHRVSEKPRLPILNLSLIYSSFDLSRSILVTFEIVPPSSDTKWGQIFRLERSAFVFHTQVPGLSSMSVLVLGADPREVRQIEQKFANLTKARNEASHKFHSKWALVSASLVSQARAEIGCEKRLSSTEFIQTFTSSAMGQRVIGCVLDQALDSASESLKEKAESYWSAAKLLSVDPALFWQKAQKNWNSMVTFATQLDVEVRRAYEAGLAAFGMLNAMDGEQMSAILCSAFGSFLPDFLEKLVTPGGLPGLMFKLTEKLKSLEKVKSLVSWFNALKDRAPQLYLEAKGKFNKLIQAVFTGKLKESEIEAVNALSKNGLAQEALEAANCLVN